MNTTDSIFSFSQAHQRALAQGKGPDEALGFGLAADMATRKCAVGLDSLLAGMPGSDSLVQLNINGLCCADAVPAELVGTEWEEQAKQVIASWRGKTTAAAFSAAVKEHFNAEELLTLGEGSLGWGGGWAGHAILGYERVLGGGVGGLRDYVQANLDRAMRDGCDELQRDYDRALLQVCDGISRFIANHAEAAHSLAKGAVDDAARAHYERMAESCSRITVDGAHNFRDAVQLFWFIHVLDDTDSPGRIDQYLLPYYLAISDSAEDRHAIARPILEALWKGFVACRSWNVCLAGQTADGQDASNELTYLFLDMQAQFRREAPNLSVRLFRGSPPRLVERCVEVIAQGCGLPALYNDEVIVPALVDLGIPLEEARNYALNGCMQIDLQGFSHMGLEDGELNLAKCLELALHEGKSPITGNQVGSRTLPVSQIADSDSLQRELQRQVEHCTRIFVRSSNLFQQVMAEVSPHLFRSLFIGDCIERGLDMKRRGARYNNGQFLTEGVANTGDSLYSIEQLVYREKRFSLAELVAVLDANFVGQEELLAYITQHLPKYGNDCPEVDDFSARPVEAYFRFLNTLSPWRGGVYSGGLSVFSRGPGYGQDLAATADGRRRGEPVADSCGPAGGRDHSGPTAMLKSVARLPHRLAASGFALNMKLSPSIFAAPDAGGRPYAKIAALFDTFFHMGGQQLQVNVVDAKTLRAAQAKPDEHRGLIVRVGGFSARFIELGKVQQDDIIARTEHRSF